MALPARGPGEPAGQWLYRSLRDAILAGRLRPGFQLPATRELARHHRLARGTAVAAFEQLRAEGYLKAWVGSGTYVAAVVPDNLLETGRPRPAPRRPPSDKRRLSGYARRAEPFHNIEPGSVRAFRCHQPALDLFPISLWASLTARRLRQATTAQLLSCPPLGYRPLRQAVADYLSAGRGVNCTADRVAIVSGTQEALDVTARVLLDPGDRAAMEDPGYPGAALVFAAAGARIVPVPVDGEGILVDPKRLRDCRLVYLTPAHQFPMGVSLSAARRVALLDWAARSGAVLFEDDYDSEFRYVGRPVPALQGIDPGASVIFSGSFSKVLFPSLRLGYLVLPEDLVERYAAVKSLTHRHPGYLEQVVLADFIRGGHLGRHLRRMREVYAERRSVLLEEIEARLRDRLTLDGLEAGLQTAGWLAPGVDAARLAERAARREVEVVPLNRYRRLPASPAREGVLLGFAAVDGPELRRGVRVLEQLLADPTEVSGDGRSAARRRERLRD